MINALFQDQVNCSYEERVPHEKRVNIISTLTGIIVPLFFPDSVYIEEGLAKVGTIVSDSDGSLISDAKDQNSIKHVISICHIDSVRDSPAPEEIAKVYIQATAFFQVRNRFLR